jgi:hypothetical protein
MRFVVAPPPPPPAPPSPPPLRLLPLSPPHTSPPPPSSMEMWGRTAGSSAALNGTQRGSRRIEGVAATGAIRRLSTGAIRRLSTATLRCRSHVSGCGRRVAANPQLRASRATLATTRQHSSTAAANVTARHTSHRSPRQRRRRDSRQCAQLSQHLHRSPRQRRRRDSRLCAQLFQHLPLANVGAQGRVKLAEQHVDRHILEQLQRVLDVEKARSNLAIRAREQQLRDASIGHQLDRREDTTYACVKQRCSISLPVDGKLLIPEIGQRRKVLHGRLVNEFTREFDGIVIRLVVRNFVVQKYGRWHCLRRPRQWRRRQTQSQATP